MKKDCRTFHLFQVTERVQDRQSLVATVVYNVYPERLKLFDYSEMFNYVEVSFCLVTPGLKPSWQSLYYPLSDGVWLALLITLFIVTLPFALVIS